MTAHDDARQRVRGFVASGFEPVRDAFAANLQDGLDTGGSVALFVEGEPVVDLVGGSLVDGSAQYPERGIQLVFSMTKGLLGMCLADLLEAGRVSLTDRVADHWPGFESEGKERVTVGQLASHAAGLQGFEAALSARDFEHWDLIAEGLAAQRPRWAPGSRHGYHAFTLGHLVGQVIRSASGMGVARYFREKFADPMGLDAWIGLPAEQWDRVVAHAYTPASAGSEQALVTTDPGSETAFAYRSPRDFGAMELLADRGVWGYDIPSILGFADARSLARAYSAFVSGSLRRYPQSLVDLVRAPLSSGEDAVFPGSSSRYGAVFMLDSDSQPMLGAGSFGHTGRGGGIALAHPESAASFAYVPNRLVSGSDPDHRRLERLLRAVRGTVGVAVRHGAGVLA